VPITAFAIPLVTMLLFFFVFYNPVYFFLLGLKTRFEKNPGYATMREYAKEVSLTYDSFIDPNNRVEFLARHSYLDCAIGPGRVFFEDGIVEHGWGGAVVGHWGFQISTDGVVGDFERGASLRVAPDIQFVYYYD
jgi:hypothetical protein